MSPKEEAKFREWAKTSGKNPDMESIDYDLRGFYKAGGKFAENGHGADVFKKPNHRTFSNQSMYHGTLDDQGNQYVGGEWGKDGGNDTYAPSLQMMRSSYNNPDDLVRYMKKYEPEATLIIPNEEE